MVDFSKFLDRDPKQSNPKPCKYCGKQIIFESNGYTGDAERWSVFNYPLDPKNKQKHGKWCFTKPRWKIGDKILVHWKNTTTAYKITDVDVEGNRITSMAERIPNYEVTRLFVMSNEKNELVARKEKPGQIISLVDIDSKSIPLTATSEALFGPRQ